MVAGTAIPGTGGYPPPTVTPAQPAGGGGVTMPTPMPGPVTGVMPPIQTINGQQYYVLGSFADPSGKTINNDTAWQVGGGAPVFYGNTNNIAQGGPPAGSMGAGGSYLSYTPIQYGALLQPPPKSPYPISPSTTPGTGPTVTAQPSGVSAAVPQTSFDAASGGNPFVPVSQGQGAYPPFAPGQAAAGGTPSPAGGAPGRADSLTRLGSDQWNGYTGALNAAQQSPFDQNQTYVTVPVDKVVVAPQNATQIEPQMGAPANVRYSRPKTKAGAGTLASKATPQRRYGGQPPLSSMPPYAPTMPAAGTPGSETSTGSV